MRQPAPAASQPLISTAHRISSSICRTLPDGTKVPDGDATFKILYRCYEKGLIVISLGANVLRIQPPLVITKEQLKKAFAIINESMADFREGKIDDSVLSFRAGW